ncbi:MAG TPA: DNA repair protein RecO [Bacteroidia bacterium]|nr:DNA repair protein RecO [Bacteroidia bacterium]
MSSQKTRGIVLRFLPFNDKNKIVKIYTEHFGLKTFIVSSGNSKSSRQKSALLQALQPIWLETSFVETAKLSRLGEITAAESIMNATLHHAKRSILMFLNEVLYKCLREEQADEPLFNFVIESITFLNKTEQNCHNFHLIFLVQLCQFLGFMPSKNYNNYAKYFFYREGVFDSFKSDNLMMDEEQSKLFFQLINLNYLTMESLALHTNSRNKLLENILFYYGQHLPSFKEIKSIEVLAEVHAN